MDSNGRHKSSASTSSPATLISTSSTFRRLPSLARPFRRNPDKDKDKDKNRDKEAGDIITEEAATSTNTATSIAPTNIGSTGSVQEGGGSQGHQRAASAIPSLGRILGETTNSASTPSSASNANTTPASTSLQNNSRPSEETSVSSTLTPLWPPSRTSSLLTSTSPAPQARTPPPPPPSQQQQQQQPQSQTESGPVPPLSPFPPKESMRDAMIASMAPPIPVLGGQSLDDMEPITYPSHLAQKQPPEAGPSTSSTASTPISATPIVTPSAIRAISRNNRDYTMGTPVKGAHERDHSFGKTSIATINGGGGDVGPEPGPGGPPTGIPRRKESVIVPGPDLQEYNRGEGQEIINGNGFRTINATNGRDSEQDTDSGAEVTTRRRRATTKSATDRPRDVTSSSKENTPTPTSGDKEASTTRIRKTSKPALSAMSSSASSPMALSRPSLPGARGLSRVPASSMYFSVLPFHGRPPGQPLRAHTGTLVGDRIWVFGGVDAKHCWRGVAWYDTESLLWTTVETTGDTLPPLRAHTTTAVGDRLYIFGGGDGPTYSNEVWSFDTITHRFTRPHIATPITALPPPRRAHTTVLYRNFLVVFGGGNGQAALNDVWALDISDPTRLTWQEWPTKGDIPQRKGYHTSNLVGDKMIVFGGSDGHASFADVHVLNLKTLTWTAVNTDVKHNRLSHTSTQVGSYLFILGGHNGQSYAQDVLLFNLVTLQWETKVPKGHPPPGRGYHVALLHDARIFISGGYNGVSVFDDLWALDLSAAAYLPQVTTFEVDETGEIARAEHENGLA